MSHDCQSNVQQLQAYRSEISKIKAIGPVLGKALVNEKITLIKCQ